jgi:hypothetical protein
VSYLEAAFMMKRPEAYGWRISSLVVTR